MKTEQIGYVTAATVLCVMFLCMTTCAVAELAMTHERLMKQMEIDHPAPESEARHD